MRLPHSPERSAKFRQAAFVYLHLGLLYEATVWSVYQAGAMSRVPGPMGLWLVAGGVIVALVFWGLWSRQNPWVARLVWLLGIIRLPTLVRGAFLPSMESALSPAFYAAALIVVLVNLWFLARAGWDL